MKTCLLLDKTNMFVVFKLLVTISDLYSEYYHWVKPHHLSHVVAFVMNKSVSVVPKVHPRTYRLITINRNIRTLTPR